MKNTNSYSSKEELVNVLSEIYQCPLSKEEYSEICRTTKNFFKILKEWHDEEQGKGAEICLHQCTA